jgi:hypothetical protein
MNTYLGDLIIMILIFSLPVVYFLASWPTFNSTQMAKHLDFPALGKSGTQGSKMRES